MSPRDIRIAAGKSQMWTAVQAGVSEPTLRLYEANRESVSEPKRKALDSAYAALDRAAQPVSGE